MRGLLAFAAIVLVHPAWAADNSHYYDGDFTVLKYEDSCNMIQVYDHPKMGENAFSVSYYAAAKKIYLNVTSKITTSLPDRGVVDLQLYFIDGNELLDDGWGTRKFDYVKSDDGETYIFMNVFSGTENVEQILTDVSQGKLIAFFYKGKAFASYKLDGSAIAISRLKDCAFEVAGLNKNDPFAR